MLFTYVHRDCISIVEIRDMIVTTTIAVALIVTMMMTPKKMSMIKPIINTKSTTVYTYSCHFNLPHTSPKRDRTGMWGCQLSTKCWRTENCRHWGKRQRPRHSSTWKLRVLSCSQSTDSPEHVDSSPWQPLAIRKASITTSCRWGMVNNHCKGGMLWVH